VFDTPLILQHQSKKRHAPKRLSRWCMCPFALLPSSKHLITYLQYTTHQPHQLAWPYPSAGGVRSPPSVLFAQSFPTGGYAPIGVYSLPQHHRSHRDPYSHDRHHSHTHPPHHADGRSHRHVQPVPMPVQVPTQGLVPMHHSSHSQSRRPSTGGGPRVAHYIFNTNSNPNLDPRHTHAKSILRNRGGSPLAHDVGY